MTRWRGRLQACHGPGTVNTVRRLVRTFQKDPQLGILGRASRMFAFFLWDSGGANSASCDHGSVPQKIYTESNEAWQMFSIPLQAELTEGPAAVPGAIPAFLIHSDPWLARVVAEC